MSIDTRKKITIKMKDHNIASDQNESTCQYCHYQFATKYGLTQHIKNNHCTGLRDFQTHKLIDKLEKQITELKDKTTKEIEELKETTNELKKEPRVSNQILQVI
jgi:hypothetical protein